MLSWRYVFPAIHAHQYSAYFFLAQCVYDFSTVHAGRHHAFHVGTVHAHVDSVCVNVGMVHAVSHGACQVDTVCACQHDVCHAGMVYAH